MSADKESILIEQLRIRGSADALAALYDLYAPRLYAFCLHMTKSREDTEEIVQATFIWLWRNRADWPPQKTLSTILFLRTRHLLINLYRANLNSPKYKDYLTCCEMVSDSSASDDLDYQDLLATLDKAMNRLPDTQRKVIKMVKIEGCPTKEVSEKLGLTEQTVRNQLSIGLKQIRKIVGNGTLAVRLLLLLTI